MLTKPTPEQIAQLRAANPQGMPRIDYREMDLVVERASSEPAADGAGKDTITVAISSEAPVLRYDWWTDERYYEVLDHSPGSVDLSYARDGLPFVMSHRAYDGDQQHGIVEDVSLGKDKKLRGEIRMSRAARSQEIKTDIEDGIRKKVSVGYIVGDDYEQVSGKAGDYPTRRYRDWMPMEVSTVPVPADYEVGIGRSQGATGQAALARFLELHPATAAQRSSPLTEPPKGKEGTMADNANAPAGGNPTPNVQVTDDRKNEVTRMENIRNLAKAHGCDDKLTEWIHGGKTEVEVIREINDILTKRLATPVQTSRGIELSEKDNKRFSFARALMIAGGLEKEAGRMDFGLERELMQEAARSMPASAKAGQPVIPYVTLKGRAGVDSGVTTTGGPFKYTQPGDFIELLRNKTSVMRAGATVLPGLTGPVSFPKQTGAATGAWVAENPGSDQSISNLITSTVSLAFKTVQGATSFSRQMLFSAASGNNSIEDIIRNDLATVIALTIDLGGITGTGASNQPTGILTNTDVGVVTLGAQGGTMAWSNWVALETAIGDANAETARMAYITNTKQRGTAKNAAVLAATSSGIPIWGGDPNAAGLQLAGQLVQDGVVNTYRAIASNQVPRNLTKGTQTTVCSAVIFGAFEHMLVGQFGSGFEVLVDPYTLAGQNMIRMVAWNFVDIALRYPTAFAVIKDAL